MDLLLRGRMTTQMVEKLADQKEDEFSDEGLPELRSRRSRYEQYLMKHPVHNIDNFDDEQEVRKIIMVRAGIQAIKSIDEDNTTPHLPEESRPYLTDGQHYYVLFEDEPRLDEYYWPELAEGTFRPQETYVERKTIKDVIDGAERPFPSDLYSLFDGFREKALKSRVDEERPSSDS